MAARIDVPGYGPMYFPEDMSDDDIRAQTTQMLQSRAEVPRAKEPEAPSNRLSEDEVFSHLHNSGLLQPHHTAGIIGSLIQESGLNPNAVNPKSGAYGLGQWLGPRKQALFDYAYVHGTHPSDPRTQLDFLLDELQTTEGAAYKGLLGTTNPEDAAKVFSTGFERAGKAESNDAARIKHARSIFDRLGGVSGAGTEAPDELKFDPREQPLSYLFKEAAARNLEELKGTALDKIPAQFASALGLDEYATDQLKEYEERMKTAQEMHPAAFPSMGDVRGISDVPGFIAENLGEQAYNIPALVGAGAAGALSPLGAAAGMGAGAFALNAPDTFYQVYKDTGELHPYVGAAFGAVNSVLDTVVPGHILNKLGASGQKMLAGKVLENLNILPKTVVGTILKDAAGEGVTEGTQQIIDNLASNYAGANKDVFEGAVEQAVRGSIGGAAFGTPGAVIGRGGPSTAQPEREEQFEQPQAEAPQVAEEPSTVLTADILKATGLKPQSGFFKQLLDKDLSNPEDFAAIHEDILPRIKSNAVLERYTKSGIEKAVGELTPSAWDKQYAKEQAAIGDGEVIPPEQRGPAEAGAPSVATGAGVGLPSGPESVTAPAGAGVPETGGVASAQLVSTGAPRGAAAQPGALRSADEMFDPESLENYRHVGYKNKEKLVSMPIDDFLKLSEKFKEHPGKRKDLEDSIRAGNKIKEIPFLKGYGGTKEQIPIKGHEGRHRAMLLKRMGYTHMPVRLDTDIRWSEQADPNKFDYREQWPKTLKGQDGDVIPFPVPREKAEESYAVAPSADVQATLAPDVGKLPLDVGKFAHITHGKDLLDTYATHGKDKGLKDLTKMLAASPYAKELNVKFLKEGDTVPSKIATMFNTGAGAVTHTTQDGSTLYFRADDPQSFGEDTVVHEAIHGLTTAAIQRNDKIRSKLLDLSSRVARALDEAPLKPGARTDAKALAKFWREAISYRPGEMLAYGLTSPTFKEVLSQYAADGRPFATQRMSHEHDALRLGRHPGSKPTPPKGLSLWDKFMDFMRKLFGIPEKNKLAFEKSMNEYHDRVAQHEKGMEAYNTMMPLADRLHKMFEDLLADTAKEGVAIPKQEEVSAQAITFDMPMDFSAPNAPFQTARGMDAAIRKLKVFGPEQQAALSSGIDSSTKAVRAGVLGFLPTHALSDLAAQHFPPGTADTFHKVLTQQDGYIHQMAEKGIDVPMNKFRAARKAAPKQQNLFNEVTNRSTIDEIDPTDPTSVANADKFSMAYVTFNPDGSERGKEIRYFSTAEQRKAAIKEYNKDRPKEERAFALRDPDVGMRLKAEKLQRQFNSLHPAWQDLYRAMRNANAAMLKEFKDSLNDRIDEAQNLDNDSRIMLKKSLYTRLAEAGMIHPYFALGREGNHWLAAEVPNVHGAYESFVTAFQDPLSRSDMETELKNRVYQHEFAKNLQRGMDAKAAHEAAYKTAVQKVRVYENVQDVDYRRVPPGSTINDILGIIESKKPTKQEGETEEAYRDRITKYNEIEKDIMQLVINALPETSFLKSLQKRKKTEGYLEDTVNVFERKTRSNIRQIANLRYRPKLNNVLEGMRNYTDALGRGQEKVVDPATGQVTQEEILPQDNTIQVQYLNEFNKHADNIFRPSPKNTSSLIKSALFGGTLGFNVSTGLIALSNLPMIVFPYLGAEYGMKATKKAMGEAAKLIKSSGFQRTVRALGSEEDPEVQAEVMKSWLSFGNYSPDSKEGKELATLYRVASASGQLNRSQLYETMLSSSRTTTLDKINAMSGWMLHTAERFNREVTLIAAYKLELEKLRNKGVTGIAAEEQAANKAVYATEMANGSIAASSAPRFTQSGLGSIVYMYKRFGVSQYYMQAKMLYDIAKGEKDPAVRKMLINRFWALTGATAMMSGVQGLPMFGIASMVYNLFKDDDDDDFNTVARKGLGELFYNGPVDYLTGLSIASRTGLSNLIIKEPISSGESGSFTQGLAESVGGPLPSMADRFQRGVNLIASGHVERGIENLLPVSAANVMKGVRYMTEGTKTLRGDTIYDDINPAHALAQMLGFTPTEVARRMEFNAKQKGISKAIGTKDSQIKGRYYLAYREHDRDGMQEAKKDLLELGKKHPDLKYTPATIGETLSESIKMHKAHTKKMFMGREYPKKQMKEVMESARDLDLAP
jgi:Phage tail lysozyme